MISFSNVEVSTYVTIESAPLLGDEVAHSALRLDPALRHMTTRAVLGRTYYPGGDEFGEVVVSSVK